MNVTTNGDIYYLIGLYSYQCIDLTQTSGIWQKNFYRATVDTLKYFDSAQLEGLEGRGTGENMLASD